MTVPTPRPEMDSNTGLEVPSPGRTLRLFARAFLLRCPNCGGGPVLRHWLRLRVRCGTCELRLLRGEHDNAAGAMFILFSLVGLAAYAVIAAALLVADTTPWDLLEVGLPILVAVLVVAFFPVAKLLWLAFDLTLRPLTEQEMAWHRDARDEFDTMRDVRG